MLQKSLFAMLAMALLTGAALAGSKETGDVQLLGDVTKAADVGLSDLADMLSADRSDAGDVDAEVLPVIGSEEKPADAEELCWRYRRYCGYRYYRYPSRGYRYYNYNYGCYYPYRYNYGYSYGYNSYYQPFYQHYGCWW